VPGLDGEVFEFTRDQSQIRIDPTTEDGRLVEDVGLLARRSNPHDARRTLTVCSGTFARGVYGAVRFLLDPSKWDDNSGFLRRQVEDPNAFALLFRVRVAGDSVVTPRFGDPGAVLDTFSPIGS
jgi:hypothetical protein